jgi:hypothetical protein
VGHVWEGGDLETLPGLITSGLVSRLGLSVSEH